jgi:hypothetical protein
MKKTLFALSLISSALAFSQEKGNNTAKENKSTALLSLKLKKPLNKKQTVPFLIFLSNLSLITGMS